MVVLQGLGGVPVSRQYEVVLTLAPPDTCAQVSRTSVRLLSLLAAAAGAPYHDGSSAAGDHLRRIFYRMGMTDQEIVALSGAHTLGRARPERSGWGECVTVLHAAAL